MAVRVLTFSVPGHKQGTIHSKMGCGQLECTLHSERTRNRKFTNLNGRKFYRGHIGLPGILNDQF